MLDVPGSNSKKLWIAVLATPMQCAVITQRECPSVEMLYLHAVPGHWQALNSGVHRLLVMLLFLQISMMGRRQVHVKCSCQAVLPL